VNIHRHPRKAEKKETDKGGLQASKRVEGTNGRGTKSREVMGQRGGGDTGLKKRNTNSDHQHIQQRMKNKAERSKKKRKKGGIYPKKEHYLNRELPEVVFMIW